MLDLSNIKELATVLHPEIGVIGLGRPNISKDQYIDAREIIFSIVSGIESLLDELIKVKMDKNYSDILESLETNTGDVVNEMVEKMYFMQKYSVCKKLYKIDKTKKIKAFLGTLNEIRNAFAHNKPLSHGGYNFDNVNILEITSNGLETIFSKALHLILNLKSLLTTQEEYIARKDNINGFDKEK